MNTNTKPQVILGQTRFIGPDQQPVFFERDESGDVTLWSGFATDPDPIALADERLTDTIVWGVLCEAYRLA